MASELQKFAQSKQAHYSTLAACYDRHTLMCRDTANHLELFSAVGVIMLGSNGATGLAAVVNDLEPGTGLFLALWLTFPSLLQLVLAAVGAYLRIRNPRGRQMTFASASEACGTVAIVAQQVAETDLGSGDQTSQLVNLIKAILTTLESASMDNQPPLPPAEKPIENEDSDTCQAFSSSSSESDTHNPSDPCDAPPNSAAAETDVAQPKTKGEKKDD